MEDFCIVTLEMEECNVVVQHAILSFLEEISRIHFHYKLPFLYLPSFPLVFKFLISSNPMAVSRISGVLLNYKKEFLELINSSKSASNVPLEIPNGTDFKDKFNSYIWLFISSLWMGKFLSSPPKSVQEAFQLSKFVKFLFLKKIKLN